MEDFFIDLFKFAGVVMLASFIFYDPELFALMVPLFVAGWLASKF